jgi:hypothetical protein
MRNGRLLWFVATWLSVAGCSSDAKPGAAPSDAGDAMAADLADTGEELVVQCDPGALEADTLITGVSAKGKTFTAKFVSSDPSPPARYDNDWTVDFTDANGAPVTDLQMTSARTWMPYHGHGWPGAGTPMSEPGRFKVKINLNMRGYFLVEMTVKSASLGSDTVGFYYCFR